MTLNKKNKLLILCFFLVLYVCYSLVFSKTINSYKEYKLHKETSEKKRDPNKEILNLRIKEKQLDSILSENNFIEDKIFQNELLKIINSNIATNKFTLIDFQEPHKFIKNKKTKLSYIFSLKGQYSSLIRLINNIENNKSLGIIIHAKFYKIRNPQNKSEELILNLILQKNNIK